MTLVFWCQVRQWKYGIVNLIPFASSSFFSWAVWAFSVYTLQGRGL